MGRQEWREQYAAMLRASVQRPSEHSAQRAAALGDSLVATRAAPEEIVAAHVACVEELCATGTQTHTTVWRAATPLLLEVMKVYGRYLGERRGRPRPLAEQARQSVQARAEAKQAQQAVRQDTRELGRRLKHHAASLAAANDRLQQEIAERQRAEEIQRESEEQLRLVADNVTALIAYVGSDRKYRFVNRQYELWYGVEREGIVGKHVRELLGDANYRAIEQYIDAALSGQAVNYEASTTYADGKTRWISAAYVPHTDPAGCTLGFYALISDITGRKRAEEALRESEGRYRQLFESLNDAALVADIETGRIVETNSQGELLLGRPREEIVRMHQLDLHPAEDADRYRQLFANHIEKGHAAESDAEVIRKDGTSVPVTISASTLSVGGRRYILGLFGDISERKRAEAALAESEARYRALFEQAPDSIVLVDTAKGAPVEFNDRACENLGYTRAEFGNLTIADLEAIESGDEVVAHTGRIIREGADTFETKHRTKTGEIRDVAVISRAVSIGGRNFALSIWRDITERKRAEEALRESEAKYRQLFATVSDAIMVFDGETKRIVDVNDTAVRLYGYSREEFLRLRHPDITAEPEESRASIEQTLAGERTRIPLRYHKKKDRTVFPVEIAASVLALGDRRLLCGVVRDITERKRAEEEARRREAELAHVSRLSLVGEMASGLSHELNQPLSTILFYARGCIRRIQSGTLAPAALLDVLEKVAVQADAAGRIVRRLREFVSKRAPHLSTVDVNETIRRALSFAEAETTRSGTTVRLQLAEALPAVRADRIQLEQVIVNLVRNGVEAMQAVELGQRELAIETTRSADNTITVGVHDTGVGLSAEIAERVFDSFFSTKPDGMGMGLSISRSIIEAHGGRLWVTPSPERGTTFRFSLPVMRGAADEDA